ncbi:MAG: asparagine synthase (glutamine-hydrolyzing) [Lachnospiraceae bacterium]|nr:asparagine synthase (glutamine-hydrolyzing) [Lachnospiraceae bacterium]
MCGILGGTKKTWNYKKALNSIVHRGPDGKRINCFDDFTMGFVRLSIIDLSDNGMQPMEDTSHSVALTFNGEIYGFEPLRNDLMEKGYSFRSTTDSEVILNSYLEWGDRFVEHIDGMYAIAILDRREKKLKLFRDIAGIKPLYYYYNGRDFAYASELKAITSLINDTSLQIDNTAILDFYNFLCIPAPKTIYKDVFKLEQACELVYDYERGAVESNASFWSLKPNAEEGNEIIYDKLGTVKELVSESIGEQLVADVPVGGFLSGGMDSSIITVEALAKTDSYQTFSIGFYDHRNNELPYVRCLEEKYGFNGNKYFVKKNEFRDLYNNLKEWYDEPFADTSAYPTFIVSREAKKKCKVMLSGEGGDELFAGYPRHLRLKDFESGRKTTVDEDLEFIYQWYVFRPLPEHKKLKKRLGISDDYDMFWFLRKHYHKDLPPITRMQYMEFYTYLSDDILPKTDRVSMANSLEVRVPFLSKKLIEYAFSLSQNERCPNGILKYVLKNAYNSELPHNLINRRKEGFTIPESFFGMGVMPQERIEELFLGTKIIEK